jgi:nucleoside-diphosphate-sugar epimerase
VLSSKKGIVAVVADHPLSGCRSIFLTGATGFLGGRIVERLALEYQRYPVCLVHNPSHMARIARFCVPLVFGDVLNAEEFTKDISECDVFVHTAYGKESDQERNWEIDVRGTENLLKIAVRNKVKHFIFISSTAIYEESFSSGCIDENIVPTCDNGNYAAAKLEAEKICLEYGRRYGLLITILRPSIIYGPFAPTWTISPYISIKNGSLRRYIDFNGICNAVYVDDVVSAVFACMCNKSAYNEVFNVAGEEKITWNDFFDFYSQLVLGKPLPEASLNCLRLRYPVNSGMKKLAKWALSTMPGFTERIYTSLHDKIGVIDYVANVSEFSPERLRFFQKKITYPVDKIRDKLGYKYKFLFAKGSWLTAEWLKSSNY